MTTNLTATTARLLHRGIGVLSALPRLDASAAYRVPAFDNFASRSTMAFDRQTRLTTWFVLLALAVTAAVLPARAAGDLTLSNTLSRTPTEDAPRTPTATAPRTPTEAAAIAESTVAGNAPVPAPVISLGIGDTVTIDVYGKPDLKTTTYIADDGTALIPLAGAVKIDGLSPAEAANRIAKALKDGEFLVNPQISVTLMTSRSQLVSVLGEVAKEGRYSVEGGGSVFDLLAQSGGRNKDAATIIYVLRSEADGSIRRTPINLDSLSDPSIEYPSVRLRGGDTLYVPKAGRFFVQGEVVTPNQYALTPDLTVTGAVALAGGVTRRGSTRRIEIKRRNADGRYVTIDPKGTDKVMPDDVIRVKESIF